MEEGTGFVKGLINEQGSVAVIATSAELEESNVAHSYLAVWKERKWTIWEEDYDVISIAAGHGNHARTLVMLGMTGESTIANEAGFKDARLGKGKNGPNRLRTMHEVRAVGQHFYAVGMRRQAFRLPMKGGAWKQVDTGVFVPDSSQEVAGFLSVDGFDDNDVYGVGYGGQIWHFDGAKWEQLPSPTNLRLECVRCAPDGRVLICGAQGVVLVGRAADWEILDQTESDDDLLSLAVLGDQVFFASDDSTLLRLHNGKFTGIHPRPSKTISTGFLDSNGKTLVSIGETDILLFDGKTWKDVPAPPIEK